VVSILPTPTPAPAPASSPLAAGSFVTYTVASGDSLYAIALRYGVAIEALAAANGLIDSVIHPDQVLIVPITQPVALSPTLMVESVPPAPVTAPSLVPDSAPAGAVDPGPYPFSALYGDLMASYPASVERARFTLRATLPNDRQQVTCKPLPIWCSALDHHEQLLGVTLGRHFDIFAAGTLFATDQSLRGHAFSRDWRTVFLFDGSGMQRTSNIWWRMS
ncbi:MAG: LysM peptidoglycan-binding domain-containing protein, partial [Anaerolineales bacterium]|nr:LysM peptidoglycan-binding domain-containing protein [Anaerolineales bacterium]